MFKYIMPNDKLNINIELKGAYLIQDMVVINTYKANDMFKQLKNKSFFYNCLLKKL